MTNADGVFVANKNSKCILYADICRLMAAIDGVKTKQEVNLARQVDGFRPHAQSSASIRELVIIEWASGGDAIGCIAGVN